MQAHMKKSRDKGTEPTTFKYGEDEGQKEHQSPVVGGPGGGKQAGLGPGSQLGSSEGVAREQGPMVRQGREKILGQEHMWVGRGGEPPGQPGKQNWGTFE